MARDGWGIAVVQGNEAMRTHGKGTWLVELKCSRPYSEQKVSICINFTERNKIGEE